MISRRPVVYVSGPWRGANTELNTYLAVSASVELLKRGCAPICVHPLIGPAHEAGCTNEQVLDADAALVARCDAILMLPGWRQSERCQFELFVAYDFGLAIYETIDELVADMLGSAPEEDCDA